MSKIRETYKWKGYSLILFSIESMLWLKNGFIRKKEVSHPQEAQAVTAKMSHVRDASDANAATTGF